MQIRIRLRIGDLRQVLTEALQLPSFIKLKLIFKLPRMPLPVCHISESAEDAQGQEVAGLNCQGEKSGITA
jgi:hypothetical protein